MRTGKKKNKEQNEEQEKIGVTRVHATGDCELRSLLIQGMEIDILTHPDSYIPTHFIAFSDITKIAPGLT